MNDDQKKIASLSILGVLVLIAFTLVVLCDTGIICSTPAHISCDDQRKLKANTVFLFDFSDPITDDVAKLIKTNITKHQDLIDVGGKLTILRITPNLYESDYEICKPQNPSELIRNKNWGCNDPTLHGIDRPRQKEADLFCKFEDEMDTMIKKINDHAKNGLPSSPLIESISKISHREDFTDHKARNIVLFSDLLQNTDKYSFYPGRGPLPVANKVIKHNHINLSNVTVDVRYIQRQHSAQQSAREFWREFFQLSMATWQITPLNN